MKYLLFDQIYAFTLSRVDEYETPPNLGLVDLKISLHILANQIDAIFLSYYMFFFKSFFRVYTFVLLFLLV